MTESRRCKTHGRASGQCRLVRRMHAEDSIDGNGYGHRRVVGVVGKVFLEAERSAKTWSGKVGTGKTAEWRGGDSCGRSDSAAEQE